VEASSTSVTRAEIIFSTPELPIVGLVYGVLELKCISIDAQRKPNHNLHWDVTCTFESGRFDQRENPSDTENPDPTTWIPVFRIDGFETRDVILTVDEAGDPICNSAGTKFETPLTRKRYLPRFSFTQYEDAGLTLEDIAARNDITNLTAFNGFDATTLKLTVTSAELGSFLGYGAWRITYQCVYDRETWYEKILDYGSEYLDGTDKKPYMDALGQYKIYGPLDGSGGKASGDAEELLFAVLPEEEFADFIRIA
jgi:hypothetical protein